MSRRRAPGRPVRIRAIVECEFACPFCDKQVQVCSAPDDAGQNWIATHPVPPCEGFVATDLLDLMRLARERLGLGGPRASTAEG